MAEQERLASATRKQAELEEAIAARKLAELAESKKKLAEREGTLEKHAEELGAREKVVAKRERALDKAPTFPPSTPMRGGTSGGIFPTLPRAKASSR